VCSTPFGIIGIFTICVVNAAPDAVQCSTPFGIIGIFTAWVATCVLLPFTRAFSGIVLTWLLFEKFRGAKTIKLEEKLCKISLISARKYLPSGDFVLSLLTALASCIKLPSGV